MKSFGASHVSYKLDEKQHSDGSDVKVLVLKSGGHVLSWSSSQSTLDHCQFDNKQVGIIFRL